MKFRNLKKDDYLNTLTSDEAGKIWYPKVIFYNTRDTEETKVVWNILLKLDDFS